MGTEITNYSAAWAEKAKAMQDRLKPETGGKTITTAGGIFKLEDEPLPGNALCVVILEAAYINSWYKGKWEPGQDASPPTCYAMSLDGEDMSPHPHMQSDPYFEPQNDDCGTCPLNQFGSAETGKGKACKNRLRLGLIRAGDFEKVAGTRNEWAPEIIEEEDHYRTEDTVFLNVPPTSLKAFKKYVAKCAADYGRPPYGLITRIDIEGMDTGGFSLTFETLEQFPDEYIGVLSQRNAEAAEAVLKPFSAPDPETASAKQGAANSRLKGLRKQGSVKARPRYDDDIPF